MADPDNIGAEFGIILRPDLKGGGLGRILMDKLIRYLKAAGTQQLTAIVLTENGRMRKLGQALGFLEETMPGENDAMTLTLDLRDSP
ncbi:N-acetyltransferase family protein [Ottowia caeni]|uniref:GNAT family N-acetyltransferase n=1 Tax=Ottowia caeni TaxID=2870339 RepID=UPI003D72597F